MIKKIDRWVIAIAMFILALSIIFGDSFAIQPTGSLTKGIYLKSDIQRPLKTGDIVSVSFKNEDISKRPDTYPLPKSMPWHNFIKIIAGVPGDIINVTVDGVFINGKYWGPVYNITSKGEPLKRAIDGEYRLEKDWFLTLTPKSRSYDSRYYGPVHKSQLMVAKPLFLLPGDKTIQNKRNIYEYR